MLNGRLGSVWFDILGDVISTVVETGELETVDKQAYI